MASPSPLAPIVSPSSLPLKEIPGGYGLPLLGAIKDRLDFFWFQGETEFWTSRMKKYKSTVFRTNVPPSPPAFPTNKVIMLLDQKSFPILFDVEKVNKKDVLLANYMPRTSFYGGIRPCVYLDPSEERHYKIKSFVMDLLKAKASKWIPETEKALSEVFPTWEANIAKEGTSEISTETGKVALNVIIRSLIGKDPGEFGVTPFQFTAWLGPQLLPIASLGLPHLLEELILHNFRLPFLFVSIFYKKIESFFRAHATDLLDEAEKKYGIEREDALHNIIFFIGFNAYGGLNILLPSIVSYVGQLGEEVQQQMAMEVREAIRSQGEGSKITPAALRKMPTIESAVYESLRMSPPVPYQYGIAKQDMVIESHDARFAVKAGEILGGCQPLAERDPVIFQEPNKFKADRFVGSEGQKLLKHVVWSNGPGDALPKTTNKQCAASDVVPLLAQIFLANFFVRYDSFTTLDPVVKGNSITYTFSSLKRASSSP